MSCFAAYLALLAAIIALSVVKAIIGTTWGTMDG